MGGNKREKLLNAMLDIVREKSYRSMRISDITERAGVGKGTFYLYFSNKEDCFRQASNTIGNGLEERFLHSGLVKSEADLYLAAEKTYEEVWENRILGRLYAYEMLETDKNFNRIFTSRNKNVYKEITRIVKPDDSEEELEIKSLMIMGIIDALIFEVFQCAEADENTTKERFIKAFIAAVNAKI